MDNKLVVFRGKEIRRVLEGNEWLFSVVDIIAALTDSDKPRDYWYRMKRREKESSCVELSTLCRQLKIPASDGKNYLTDVVNTENAFRMIQTISRPRRIKNSWSEANEPGYTYALRRAARRDMFEENRNGGNTVIPVKTGKRCEFFGR